MKALVFAEKPSHNIARVLCYKDKHKHYIEGPKFVVTWALWHLIELIMPKDATNSISNGEYKISDLPIIRA